MYLLPAMYYYDIYMYTCMYMYMCSLLWLLWYCSGKGRGSKTITVGRMCSRKVMYHEHWPCDEVIPPAWPGAISRWLCTYM